MKARWHEEGEKSTKYFLNLEKRNYVNKTISKLNIDDYVETVPKKILLAERAFYSNLYHSSFETNHFDNVLCDQFFPQPHANVLPEIAKKDCEGLLSIEECFKIVNSLEKGKTPGTDGLPAEFYKILWPDIKFLLIDALNFAFEFGEMSTSQRRGIITLLPKKNKNPLLLGNWRPISILNTDYKIAAKAIAFRIKNHLTTLIGPDQTGFIQGRYIGENIVTILEAMHYTEEKNIPGMLFCVDFEKAFDKLEW